MNKASDGLHDTALIWVRATRRKQRVEPRRSERLPAKPHVMSDRLIRIALHNFVAHHMGEDPSATIVDELSVGSDSARIDLAVLSNSFHGYEIKSELDSLRRLSRQIEAYSNVLDFATLVVTPKHLAAALQALPAWWEVVTALPSPERGIAFEVARPGYMNPTVNLRSLAQLMWRDQALRLLESKGYAGWRSKEKWRMLDRICEVLPSDEIKKLVRESVKERGARRAAQLLE
jgi:hypothetical protein